MKDDPGIIILGVFGVIVVAIFFMLIRAIINFAFPRQEP